VSELLELTVALGELEAQLSKFVVTRVLRALRRDVCGGQLALGACERARSAAAVAVVVDAKAFEGVKERGIGHGGDAGVVLSKTGGTVVGKGLSVRETGVTRRRVSEMSCHVG
jgi:hypothetical protein